MEVTASDDTQDKRNELFFSLPLEQQAEFMMFMHTVVSQERFVPVKDRTSVEEWIKMLLEVHEMNGQNVIR